MADLLTTSCETRTFARLEKLQAVEARAFAERAERLAGLVAGTTQRYGASNVDKHLALELAGVLRVGQGRAMGLALDAVRLCEELPRTLAGLKAGSIWVPQATVLLRETKNSSQPVTTETERRVLADGGGVLCPSDLTRLVKRHLLQVEADLEPGATADREAEAREGRQVTSRPVEDGMALTIAVGTAEQTALHNKALDVLCAQAKAFDETNGVVRTAAQRRLDVLMELPGQLLAWQQAVAHAAAGTPARHGGHGDHGDPSPGGLFGGIDGAHLFGADGPFAPGSPFVPASTTPVPTINLHLPMASALGLSNEPGHLEGYGPVSAAHVRRLLPDARLRRVIVDAQTGLPLAVDQDTLEPTRSHRAARAQITEWVSETEPYVVDDTPEPRYRPSRRLRELVNLRDMRCSGPGCGQPAHVCDFEHRQPYDHAHPERGGQTSAANGHPASDRCHDAKTHGGWTLTRHEDGSTTWTSPHGHAFRRPAFWRPPPTITANATLRPPDDPALLGRASPRGPTSEHDSNTAHDDQTGPSIDAARDQDEPTGQACDAARDQDSQDDQTGGTVEAAHDTGRPRRPAGARLTQQQFLDLLSGTLPNGIDPHAGDPPPF